MRLTELRGRRVVVWGTGREGVAAIRAIAPVGPASLVAIEDVRTFSAHDWTGDLAALAPLRTGDDAHAALLDADVLVRSPGIRQTHPWVRELRDRGVPVTGGTALWMAGHASRTIAVTGSKGKSTTSALVSHLLTAAGRPNVFGGNIGVAALSLPDADRYVLELSVYQCADLTDSPRVAALTSLFPEHLDWSGGEREYYRDKLTIVDHGPEAVVYNGSDARLSSFLVGRGLPLVAAGCPPSFHVRDGVVCLDATPLFPRSAFALPGRHNATNLCVALAALDAYGVDCVAARDSLLAALVSFRALDHRMTPIEDPSGLTFVDDSLSTIPQSAIHAIEAYADRPLTVILGGEDRGVDYRPLREYLDEAGVTATLIGVPDSGPRILGLLSDLPRITTVTVDDLVAAVRVARERTPAGGVVLLSPAAPSYGRFDNYEHRSRVFRAAIESTR